MRKSYGRGSRRRRLLEGLYENEEVGPKSNPGISDFDRDQTEWGRNGCVGMAFPPSLFLGRSTKPSLSSPSRFPHLSGPLNPLFLFSAQLQLLVGRDTCSRPHGVIDGIEQIRFYIT